MKPLTIAIDGSAASGKSTLGQTLAHRLNYLYLDTGVMYRAVTWAALNATLDVSDEAAVSNLAATMKLEIAPPTVNDGRQATVWVDGQDVTWLIRKAAVNDHVSQVSCYSKVRQILTDRQRQIARAGPVVMVGRDIGTVVLPDADLKIFTVASVEVRAKRRYKECLEREQEVDFDQLLAAMIRRDRLDARNPIAPMVPAPDAVVINTDNLSQAEVLKKVEALICSETMPR
ncbi:MAG: (d)CMP kinase [Anaerolineae bacterium]